MKSPEMNPSLSPRMRQGPETGAANPDNASETAGAPAPSPETHLEWGDWTVADTDTAREIMNYLGYGSDASREPGADRRRDKIAAMIRARIDTASTPAPEKHLAVSDALLKETIEAVWRCSLIIESSVRRGDGPIQYAEVLYALELVKEVRAALATTEGSADA